MTEVSPAVLWTVMPMELVLAGMEPQMRPCVEVAVEGRLLQVVPEAGGTARVQRLLSTDPQDYLDPRWQPGAAVWLPVSDRQDSDAISRN